MVSSEKDKKDEDDLNEREDLDMETKDDEKKDDEDSKLSTIVQQELNQFIAEQNDDEDAD